MNKSETTLESTPTLGKPMLDSEVFDAIQAEQQRQEENLELIASENATSNAVMQAQGSVLTNKYAEGYPNKRYYGGCEFADQIESIALKRACSLFGSEAANVQPHSGSSANMAVYLTVLKPGDKLMGMNLAEGGHLTHGSPVNFSGKLFEVVFYGVDSKTGRIDMNQVEDIAKKERPKAIVAGASAYSRVIDFQAFRQVANQVDATLIVDMAHIAGLVATGLHPSPVPHADYVTTTTHKTLRGPRGGLILTSKERIKAINSTIFPGMQGGPLMHVVAAKAVALQEAASPSFKRYQEQVVANARSFAHALVERGFDIVGGGTDTHLFLVNLINKGITGKALEQALDKANITLNKNAVPNDPLSPFVTSGVRIGTPTITTRGMGSEETTRMAEWVELIARNADNHSVVDKVKKNVIELTRRFPLYKTN